MAEHAQTHAQEPGHDHLVSPSIYIAILVALLVLLSLTLTAAFVDLDRMLRLHYVNMAVAVLIAIFKAILIILFFMHVKYSSRLHWAFAAAAFLWLGIMLTLSLSDYLSRGHPQWAPKSEQDWPTPRIMRPEPRHDAVVGDAGDVAPPALARSPMLATSPVLARSPAHVAPE